jgi:hypothetical protein
MLGVALLVTGCNGTSETAAPAPPSATPPSSAPSPTSSPSPSPSPAQTSSTPTKDPEPIYTDADSGSVITFKKGYPKIVSVSKISSRVDVDTYFKDERKAVALAPGVWTNLSDGAELQDAAAGGALVGLCASIEAFERQNPEISRGHTCW